MTWKIPGHIWPVLDGNTLQHAITNLALGAAGTVMVGFLAGKYLPKSRVFRPIVLSQRTDKAEGFTAAKDHSELIGKEGTAEMNLHPAGRMLIDGKRVNVITRGEFIESGSTVRVIEAHGAHIIVEKT